MAKEAEASPTPSVAVTPRDWSKVQLGFKKKEGFTVSLSQELDSIKMEWKPTLMQGVPEPGNSGYSRDWQLGYRVPDSSEGGKFRFPNFNLLKSSIYQLITIIGAKC